MDLYLFSYRKGVTAQRWGFSRNHAASRSVIVQSQTCRDRARSLFALGLWLSDRVLQ